MPSRDSRVAAALGIIGWGTWGVGLHSREMATLLLGPFRDWSPFLRAIMPHRIGDGTTTLERSKIWGPRGRIISVIIAPLLIGMIYVVQAGLSRLLGWSS